MSIDVSIIEDDDDLRESLAVLFKGTSGFNCLSRFESAETALRQIRFNPPAVVLVDINLPKMSGIECVAHLKNSLPALQCVMLTVIDDGAQIFDALMAGASGYLLKGTPPSEILHAIKDVHEGGSPMSSIIARKVVRYFQKHKPADLSAYALSPRELQILELLASGKRYKEIASDLGISEFTVRNHLRNIYEKLQVTSRTEAVVKFLQNH